MRRSRRFLTAGVVVAAVAGTLGTVGIVHGHLHGSLDVATLSGGGSGDELALLEGPLHGQVNDDGTACFWVERDGYRTAVMWPKGWSADDHPLRILDDWTHTVARVGDTVSIGGGGSLAPIPHCPASAADGGFYADHVQLPATPPPGDQ